MDKDFQENLTPSIKLLTIIVSIGLVITLIGFFVLHMQILEAVQLLFVSTILLYASITDIKTKLVSNWVHLIIFIAALFTFIPEIIDGSTIWIYKVLGLILVPLPFIFGLFVSRPKTCKKCGVKLGTGTEYCSDCGRKTEEGHCVVCEKEKGNDDFCKNCGEPVPCPIGGGDIKLAAVCGFLLGFENAILGLFIGLVSAIIIKSIGILIKKSSAKVSIALVPYLSIGFFIAYLIPYILPLIK